MPPKARSARLSPKASRPIRSTARTATRTPRSRSPSSSSRKKSSADPVRRLGLIGGLSWESTRLYYDAINRAVAAHLGGAHSAPLIVDSLDFAPIAKAQAEGRWDDAGAAIVEAAERLHRAGAEAVAIGSNTMHKC